MKTNKKEEIMKIIVVIMVSVSLYFILNTVKISEKNKKYLLDSYEKLENKIEELEILKSIKKEIKKFVLNKIYPYFEEIKNENK